MVIFYFVKFWLIELLLLRQFSDLFKMLSYVSIQCNNVHENWEIDEDSFDIPNDCYLMYGYQHHLYTTLVPPCNHEKKYFKQTMKDLMSGNLFVGK